MRLLAMTVLLLATLSLHAAPPATAPSPATTLPFVKGYTWGWWGIRGHYADSAAAESMKLLAANNADTAAIAFVAHMPAHNVPMIAWSKADPRMVTDDEIRHAIELARTNKLRVILKPVFDCLDKTARSKVDFRKDTKEDPAAWKLWWECYEEFILHYARIAQDEKCEAFVIGCELSSTEKFEKEWRALITKIRRTYTGPLIYNTAHMREMDVTWWDAVDIIGVGVYWTVGTETDFSKDTMLKSFKAHRDRLKKLSEKWKRPVLFAEIGCRSALGCQVWPGDNDNWQWPANAQVQANFYQAALECFWDEPWFLGYVWWDWPAKLYDKGKAAEDKQFYIYGKPAEQILRTWYAKPSPVRHSTTQPSN